MQQLSVRKYKPEDWPRLVEIHDSARKTELRLAQMDDAFLPLCEAAPREGLFVYHLDVAVLNHLVVGFIAYSEDEIAWLYVDLAFARQGIGKCLVAHALENIPVRPVVLEVLSGNEPAIRFYHALGFETVEKTSGAMPGNESFQVTVYRMHKTQ